MARYSFWALGESHVSLSGNSILDGITQGDGSHLVGEIITLNDNAWEEIFVRDDDANVDDNDNSQVLDGNQSFDGVTYGDNLRLEAEYEFVVQDLSTGETYRILSVNFNNSQVSFSTVEGLAFVDSFPPIGVPLKIISAKEGPGGNASVHESELAAPPCFTTGTKIVVKGGEKAVEALEVGDEVLTRDNGFQKVRWLGQVSFSGADLKSHPQFRPIRIRRDAFGPGMPHRDMLVSPQHRVLLLGWRAELWCGEREVLAAATHLVNDRTVTVAHDVPAVTYVHVQFDQHEIITSDGLATESFNPGPQSLKALPNASRRELFALFPELKTGAFVSETARPVAHQREAQIIAQAI
ncbi:Hint domain-containing protein [Shimia sp. R9_3]|uniref:Hint domain-containing protein n=1 Tax=Shimia sp. R9_3 TaxID=2821113 RepID=UPI001ADBD293|nr:Hint domain-containing protein [Shimia sp. R9_3]MBO9400838.1 Hint domain-containing protein [Shimia sp. R9_3]